MQTFIHHIATRVPEFVYSQEYARERMKEWVRDARLRKLVHAIYNRSGIERRHSVISDFHGDPAAALVFKTGENGELLSPGTASRNAIYAEASRALAVQLARETIAGCPQIGVEEITHVVFASCTGFCNPGPDYHIVRELGIRDSVERYTLGFMGCYAAFPALRMARQFCLADPEAVVLVMCLELCSLHIQVTDQPDTLLANSLFADGAAAAIVSARVPAVKEASFRLDGFGSALVPAGEQEMAWEIGDTGFNIVLSSYVPDIIGSNIYGLIAEVLGREGLSPDEVGQWVVHPGGRAILDKVEQGLGLPDDALAASRSVLRDYGNMSSASILFVLERLLKLPTAGARPIAAMAFGPGLTVELALLRHAMAGEKEEAIDVSPGEVAVIPGWNI